MNEKLNLVETLKDCPTGTKFYTPVWGEVSFRKLLKDKIYSNNSLINTNIGKNEYDNE